MALFKTSERIRLCAVLGLAIALASPVISQMDWSGVPWIMRGYIIPDYNAFGIFPWGAYLAFGVSAGSVIRSIPPDATDRCMQWAAILGGGLILVCQYFANASFSLYSKSDFWLNSPAQVLTKVGRPHLMVALAFYGPATARKTAGAGYGNSVSHHCWCTGCTSNWSTDARCGS